MKNSCYLSVILVRFLYLSFFTMISVACFLALNLFCYPQRKAGLSAAFSQELTFKGCSENDGCSRVVSLGLAGSSGRSCDK